MQAYRLITYAQLSFFGLMALCVVLLPGEFMANGISYFGAHQPTALPYSLAFLSAAYFFGRAGSALRGEPEPLGMLARILRVEAMLFVAILAFPYQVSPFFHFMHVAISVAAFVLEFLASAWMAVVSRSRHIACLFLAELACGIVSALSLPHLIGLEAFGEIGFQLFFTLALGRFVLLAGVRRPTEIP